MRADLEGLVDGSRPEQAHRSAQDRWHRSKGHHGTDLTGGDGIDTESESTEGHRRQQSCSTRGHVAQEACDAIGAHRDPGKEEQADRGTHLAEGQGAEKPQREVARLSGRPRTEPGRLPAGEGHVPGRPPRSERQQLAQQRQSDAHEVARSDHEHQQGEGPEAHDRPSARQPPSTGVSTPSSTEVIELVEALVVAERPAEARRELWTNRRLGRSHRNHPECHVEAMLEQRCHERARPGGALGLEGSNRPIRLGPRLGHQGPTLPVHLSLAPPDSP